MSKLINCGLQELLERYMSENHMLKKEVEELKKENKKLKEEVKND